MKSFGPDICQCDVALIMSRITKKKISVEIKNDNHQECLKKILNNRACLPGNKILQQLKLTITTNNPAAVNDSNTVIYIV